MKNNVFASLIFFAVVITGITGCAEKAAPPDGENGYTTDVQAEQIPVVPRPEFNRIISAAPSITEIIAGLGLADKLVAVDKYSKDIDGVRKDLPEIDFFNPDLEAIAELEPDIIIMGEINTNGAAETPFAFLQKLEIDVLVVATSNSIEEIYRDIITIAETLGARERGEELAAGTRLRIEQIADRARTGNERGETVEKSANDYETNNKPSVYFEITPAPNMVSFGGGTYLNELVELAGARNIFAAEKRWFTPGPEAIIAANPDMIFIIEGASDPDEIKNRPGFDSVNAVRNNRIFAVNANQASRPSQNIVPALEAMAAYVARYNAEP